MWSVCTHLLDGMRWQDDVINEACDVHESIGLQQRMKIRELLLLKIVQHSEVCNKFCGFENEV